MTNRGNTHSARKMRDEEGRVRETAPKPCLRCRKTFDSEGAHHRLCVTCARLDVSPYAV